MAIVYQHKRKDCNEVFYVGVGKNIKRAYCKHKRNKYWNNVVNKYGYYVDVSHKDLTFEDCLTIEVYLISFWRENGKIPLCNATNGGEGTLGYKFDVKSKEKLSKTQKLRLADKHNHPLYGKKHTQESIEKNRQSNKGDKSFNFGKKGQLHSRYGASISEEQKEKIIESNKKRAKITSEIIDAICSQYIYRKVTLTHLAKKYNVSFSTIGRAIKKRQNEIHNGRKANNSKVSMEGMA
jgi:hypothetical protein